MIACQLQHSEDCTSTRKRYSTKEIFAHEELRQIARTEEHDKDLQIRAKELFNIELSQSTANRLRNSLRPKAPKTPKPDEEGNIVSLNIPNETPLAEGEALLSDNCNLAALVTSVPIATAPFKRARHHKTSGGNVATAVDALISTASSTVVSTTSVSEPVALDLSSFVHTEQV